MSGLEYIQAAAQDTMRTMADSTFVDPALRDTVSAVGAFSRDIGEAGQRMASGDLNAFESMYEGIYNLLISFIPDLLSAVVVFALLYLAYRAVGYFFGKVLSANKRVDPGLRSLLLKTFRIVAWSFIAVMVISQFGVNVTALIAGLSIVGIAVGFAAQDTVQNFISGITILIDRPFRVGHFVEIEGIHGTVEEITLRSTRVRTLNNQILVLPNAQMINQKLINHTMLGVLRIEVPFGIAYREYPYQARAVVLRETKGDSRLHPDHPATVVVDSLADSSINMILRLYLQDPSQEVEMRFEYTEKVRESLRRAGIEIPFPHVHVVTEEPETVGSEIRPGSPPRPPWRAVE